MTETELHAKRHRKEMRRRPIRKAKRWSREHRRRFSLQLDREEWALRQRRIIEAQEQARIDHQAKARAARLSQPGFFRRIINRIRGH